MRFLNKVAIVTGGASGIGEATVRNFIQHGAKVVIADLNEEKGEQLANELNEKSPIALFVKTDVSVEEQNQQLIDKTVQHFGQLDILFANAGIALDSRITSMSVEKWKKELDINLTAVFIINKYAIEYWLKNKIPGVIVNCGSIHSWVGKAGLTAYAASKGGVKLLTQSLAIDYAEKGIRINAICPGYIDTPFLSKTNLAGKNALKHLHPIGRLGTAEEVANVVSFLASDEASFIHGSAIVVDGGYTAQ